eukprot:TRINITY_DN6870_c0_g1_i1.p1 TRINITY_DN6870_c0_g1~~TRINITY_DN6870_c0_g1_i1.p1  ORF type:complete len:174 (-),score=63.50 TRINITY_DN6870_c0_g1_i1:131-652(-)
MEPVEVLYCGVCKMPPEYCEFDTKKFKKCQPWIEANCPEVYPELFGKGKEAADAVEGVVIDDSQTEAAASDAKGGKKGKKGKAKGPQVILSRIQRNKRKFVTVVKGLDTFDVKLAEASKVFSKKFSCGASVVKGAPGVPDQIDIQGDVRDELCDVIHDKYDIPLDKIMYQDKK